MAKKEKDKSKPDISLETRQKNFKESSIGMAIIFAVISGYIGFTISAMMLETKRLTLVEAIQGLGLQIKNNPFLFITVIKDNGFYNPLPTLLLIFMAELFVLIDFYTNKGKIHNDLNTSKGSAEWFNVKDFVKKFAEFGEDKGGYDSMKNHYKNIIFSKNCFVSMDTHRHRQALNTLVIGASGTGKSRFFLKPNVLQMNSSYVITDPRGDLLDGLGEMLRRNGYNVKVFNLDPEGMARGETDKYNPLKYCNSEADIRKVIEIFMKNMNPGEGKGSSDPFWDDSTRMFLSACVGFLTSIPEGYDVPYALIPEVTGGLCFKACFANLCELTRMAGNKWKEGESKIQKADGASVEPDRNAPQKSSELGVIFENLRVFEAKRQGVDASKIQKPYCLMEWENFWNTPDKTATTIMTTTAVKLDAFNIDTIKNMTSDDTLDLYNFGKHKEALFLIIPPTDKTYNFLISLICTQLFDLLYNLGVSRCEGTKMLRLKNTELVKFFEREEVTPELEDRVKAIKNAKYTHVVGCGLKEGEIRTKDKKGDTIYQKVTIDDGWYDITYEWNGKTELLTRRPDEESAKKFLKDLQKADLTTPRQPTIPFHVRFLIDEFPNIGEIPEFLEKLATMRGYEISATVICQSITQLKQMYEKNYESIDGNCPFVVYLGGNENATCEYLSKKLGKATIRVMNNSIDSKKISNSNNHDSRDLMSPDEIGRMSADKELFFVNGEQPIIDDKYDLPSHKNYKYSHDYACDCGLNDAIVFDKSVLSGTTFVETIYKAEIATANCDVADLDIDSMLSALAINNPDDIIETAEKNIKRFSFESNSEAVGY